MIKHRRYGQFGLFLLIVCVGGLMGHAFQTRIYHSGPRAEVSEFLWDHGRVWDDQPLVSKFIISNPGSEALDLTVSSTSCSCIDAILDRTSLPPGESTYLTIRNDPKSESMEKIEAHVVIRTNDDKKPELQFTVKAEPWSPITLSSSTENFRQLNKEDFPVSARISVRHLGEDKGDPRANSISVLSSARYLEGHLVKAKEGNNYFLEFTLNDYTPLGSLEENLVLETADGYRKRVDVYAQVAGDITVEPESLFFGSVESDKTYERICAIKGIPQKHRIEIVDVENHLEENVAVTLQGEGATRSLRARIDPRSGMPESRPTSIILRVVGPSGAEHTRIVIPIFVLSEN